MSDLVDRARRVATLAHGATDQRRKYTGEPYIVHPAALVDLVRSVPHDDAMLAAAWLHDVVEDTYVLQEDIAREFGADVGALVEWLTDTSLPADGNRAARKAINRRRLAQAPARAQTIKVADLIDNTRTILARDPGFARVYLPEKRALLDVLVRADRELVAIARRQIDQAHGS